MLQWKWALRLLVPLLACLCMSPVHAEKIYAKASYAGQAHGPGCGKGFTDITGHCWACPAGYQHDNILLTPDNPKVCKKSGKTHEAKGTEVGKSTLGICKKGWLSTNNGKCYECPKGYSHNVLKFGTTQGVCYKKTKDAFSAAHSSGGSLLCNKGYFSPSRGGSCWTCPASSPQRTLDPVNSDKACVNAACGAQGERLCMITERITPCDLGTVPDLVKNQCVGVNLKEAVCKTLVTALRAGELPKGFLNVLDLSRSKTKDKSGVNNRQLLDQIASDITPYQARIPEIKRIYTLMNNSKNSVKTLFSPDTFCSRAAVNAKLNSLRLKPNFASASPTSDHFYMAYSLSFSLAAAAGVQGGFVVATDYRGNTASFVYLGPQVVSNASLSDSLGVQFFPAVKTSDFAGWGFDVGVSGGPPSKIVGGGADVSFDDKFKFQGFGVSGSIGLGVIPADIGISATHSWQMF
jgi:hypothetical protein